MFRTPWHSDALDKLELPLFVVLSSIKAVHRAPLCLLGLRRFGSAGCGRRSVVAWRESKEVAGLYKLGLVTLGIENEDDEVPGRYSW